MRLARRSHGSNYLLVEITPMIDVVFLLIIFFLTTAQFARLTRADLDLPTEKGEQQEIPDEAGLIINITRDGDIIVSELTIELEDLEDLVVAAIAAAPGQSAERMKLLLRVDQNASAARLNEVVDLLQRYNVGAARLATEIPSR